MYIDDTIIFAPTLDEHLSRFETILQGLQEAGLEIRPDKCIMLQCEVLFLGHVISGKGIKTSASKTDMVASQPVPTNTKEVHSFLATIESLLRVFDNHSSSVD